VASCVARPVSYTCSMAATLVVFGRSRRLDRYISMGSVIASAALPLAVWILAKPTLPPLLAAILAGGFVIYKHSSNIARLRQGTEHVFRFGAPKH